MRKAFILASICLCFGLAVAQTEEDSSQISIMDQGQCTPYYDHDVAFWGYDCEYSSPENPGKVTRVKIPPQFSWASPFINGRAKVLLGCRLRSCNHEPKGRKFHKRLYAFIDPSYHFVPEGPYDPAVWNPANYAIYNEEFSHVGHFGYDYEKLACVGYKKQIGYINVDGDLVFLDRDEGKIAIPLNSQIKTYLEKTQPQYKVEGEYAVVEPTGELIAYLTDTFKPPKTPVKSDYLRP